MTDTKTCRVCGRRGVRNFIRDDQDGQQAWRCASWAACRESFVVRSPSGRCVVSLPTGTAEEMREVAVELSDMLAVFAAAGAKPQLSVVREAGA
ncbi:hypothetical protein [Nocardia farcinica]|uniref:hypothetical protein n=1 Tax=Nocardia farcinica TaxID=37329 RepID=UPI001893A456|nr:hypothetical protein [Nocardia farcinica]MBF6254435.1 hypothetical protein [Nocardia farcinica]